jgi:hypothetical protein
MAFPSTWDRPVVFAKRVNPFARSTLGRAGLKSKAILLDRAFAAGTVDFEGARHSRTPP